MSLPYSSHFWNLLDCGSPTRDEKRYDWMLLASQTASPLAMLPAERLVGGAAAAVASGHQGRRACAKVTHKNTDCRCRSSQRRIRWPCAFARSFAFGCWATRTGGNAVGTWWIKRCLTSRRRRGRARISVPDPFAGLQQFRVGTPKYRTADCLQSSVNSMPRSSADRRWGVAGKANREPAPARMSGGCRDGPRALL